MILYNLVVLLYGFVIRLASLRKLKARNWVEGRKNWRERYAAEASKKLRSGKIVWVHCASYGEFEQGRPLIDAIKKEDPSRKIVLSFFSPSGYEAFKDWNGADLICYLPLDTKSNAIDFISTIKPDAVIFIKYEFWLNFLFELKNRNIPTYLVSAVFKPHHPFFKWYGGIFRRSLTTFKKLFIQDQSSGKLLLSAGISHFEVCGDTRFDRVLEIKSKHQPIEYFEKFCVDSKIIVGGSTWPGDENLLIESFEKLKDPKAKLVLVPHEIDDKSILKLTRAIEDKKFSFSKYSEGNPDPAKQILVVDAMGLLSRIYFYADAAYVGGGFDGGLHNTLEPAVYGIPVFFYGKDHSAYNEVVEMSELKVAQGVMNSDELSSDLVKFFNDPTKKMEIKTTLEKYFESRSNVTQKILSELNIGR